MAAATKKIHWTEYAHRLGPYLIPIIFGVLAYVATTARADVMMRNSADINAAQQIVIDKVSKDTAVLQIQRDHIDKNIQDIKDMLGCLPQIQQDLAVLKSRHVNGGEDESK